MSVTEVVEQLRRAHARLTEARAAAVVAETTIREGREIFDHGTAGSIWPHVHEIRRLGAEAGDDVRLAHTAIIQAQEIINDYCVSIAGHGIGGAADPPGSMPEASRTDGEADRSPVAAGPTDHGAPSTEEQRADWIADRERAGAVINPQNVTRINKLPDGRIVWVEGKNPDGGEEHILDSQRVEQFGTMRVPKEDIIPLVFAALERGEVIGYSGVNRRVYEVVFKGERRRIAITVTRDGLIVGAHPISLKHKVRTRLHRS
ncbi:hypothetical protein FHR81_002478 [Actinoalloteichus hoggarensis]|uniref:Uncharacterized protein n=1 Tax=Actinoalloteichus hoggarensis TaxID=1470176 RepID=A0A221VXU7_9PSEU|nr:hypothetical protein [Actinoalloteichus hoggarensis]ASO18081.1 hypothetical protein AHOG_02085 [Actinoalloteichus hoggarensis]MBB5921438.1 hypothetical protein [Actinoalloteichus hoggarensis]